VLRGHLQDRIEAVGIAGLGEELPGLGAVVRHDAGQVDEVGIERIDVRAEDAAEAEHRALDHLGLVDGVGHGPAHSNVRITAFL
jgi:hypothetical protein